MKKTLLLQSLVIRCILCLSVLLIFHGSGYSAGEITSSKATYFASADIIQIDIVSKATTSNCAVGNTSAFTPDVKVEYQITGSGSAWTTLGTIVGMGPLSNNSTLPNILFLKYPVRGVNYSFRVSGTTVNMYPCNAGSLQGQAGQPVGGAGVKTFTVSTGSTPASWVFSDLSVSKQGNNNVITWNDPTDVKNLQEAVDEWYYEIRRSKKPTGSNIWSSIEVLKTKLGYGSTFNRPVKYDDNLGTETCYDYKYGVTLFLEKGSAIVKYKSEDIELIEQINAPEPNNFIVENEDVCNSTSRDLRWEIPTANINACADLWFSIDRYKVGADNKDINSSKVTLVRDKSGTTYGGSIQGSNKVSVSSDGSNTVFKYRDNYNLENTTKYRYKMSAHAKINANGIIGPELVKEYTGQLPITSVQGTLDNVASLVTASVIGNQTTLNWTDEWNNEEKFKIFRNEKGASGDGEFLGEVASGITTYTFKENTICTELVFTVKASNACSNDLVIGTVGGSGPTIKVDGDLTETYLSNALAAYKGYQSDFVQLNWAVENNSGSIVKQNIYRRTLGDLVAPELITTVGAGIRQYRDFDVESNVLHEYFLEGEGTCGSDPLLTNRITDVGYRAPFGLVSGRVEYEGGISVKDCEITVENSAGVNPNKSVYFDGDRDFFIFVDNNGDSTSLNDLVHDKQTDLDFMLGDKDRTIEFWLNATEFNNGYVFRTGRKEVNGSYMALVTPSSGNKNWKLLLGDTTKIDFSLDIDPGDWHHYAITCHQDTIKIYLDGKNDDRTWNRTVNTIPDDRGHVLVVGSNFLTNNSGSFKGYMDEFRCWGLTRTEEEIRNNKSGFLQGNEDGLGIYLRMDENVGDNLYDASYKTGYQFNKNHATINRDFVDNHLFFSDITPISSKLGNNAVTDVDGNYVVKHIRYENNGELFKITPFIKHHKFQPNNRSVFVGKSVPVQNGQDFKDISSFLVTGTVFYGNSETDLSEPASGIYLAVDGNIVVKDGLPVQTNADGEFSINVPIGDHYVSVQKSLHSFVAGRFPAIGTFDFQEPKSGLSFVDNTKLVVIGKVVGGTREGNKISGLGRTKNNIGQATLIFESTGGIYADTVTTDEHGEYRTEIFPLEYILKGGAVAGNDQIFIASNPTITFETQTVNLSEIQPLQTVEDTLFDNNGNMLEVDKVEYNYLKDFVYRSAHSLFVENTEGGTFDKGESIIVIKDQDIRDTIYTDQLDKPVFYKDGTYSANIRLTEIYANKDDQSAIVYDTVGVTDAEITVNNGLSGENLTFNINSADGDSLYTFTVGDPNLTTNPTFPELDYLKKMEITSVIGLEQNTWSLDGYVLGAKQDGTKFTTTGPKITDHILRDPPGSNSSASITKGSEFRSNFSWNLAGSVEAGATNAISVGAKVSVGLGVAVTNVATAETSYSLNGKTTLGGGNDYSETVVFAEDLSTSADPSMVGADADLFIGKSMNMDFGVADVLQFVHDEDCGGTVPCKTTDAVVSTSGKTYMFGRKKGFQIDPTGYDTYFIYTQRHIRTKLIPDLIVLRNQILDGPDYTKVFTDRNDPKYGANNDDPVWGSLVTSDTPFERELADFSGPSYLFTKVFAQDEAQTDSVRWYNQQIRLWKDAMALNEEMKINAIDGHSVNDAGNLGETIGARFNKAVVLLEQKVGELEKNISFSSGSSYSRSVALSNDLSYRFTWEVDLSLGFGLEVEGDIGGTGASSETSLTFGVTQSGETSRGESHSIEYGFTLEDENIGDYYSVDILDGGNQNGPIFKVRGAETSCPYEGAVLSNYFEPGTQIQPSTVRRDKPGISISPSRQVGIPSDQEAVFNLTLSNSNTDDAMTYVLYLDDATNPHGAIMTIDGQNINRTFYIPAGSSINKTLLVKKSPQANEYKDIALYFASDCDTSIYESASFSVSYIPTCSKSALLSPTNQWVLNSSYNDTLPVIMSGYDLNFAGFEKAVFRYKPSTSANWINAFEFYNRESAGGDTLLLSQSDTYTTLDWDISNLRDGNYDIQIKTVCPFGVERFSETYSGKVDRLNPVNFGKPTPLNGVLTADDELNLRFNETINEGLITKNLDIDIRAVLNGTEIAHFTSLAFDGNQVMEIPTLSINDRSFSLELFAKRAGTRSEVLVSQSDWELGIDEIGNLYFEINGERLTGEKAVSGTSWNHIALTYDRSSKQAYLYLNGEADLFKTMASTISASSEKLKVGESFTGNIHELRLWSDLRTFSEIRANYLYAQKSNAAGLLGYWPMDEGKGTTAFDKTGRRNATVPNSWSFAQEARAIELNGTDQYFEIDAAALNADEETDITISFWFKTANVANSTLLSNGNTDEASSEYKFTAWSIYADASGKLFVKNNGYVLPVNNPTITNEWHHFALVVNRQGNTDVYYDGHVTASVNSSHFSDFAGSKVYVGANGRFEMLTEFITDYFSGSFDELRFWNAAREQKQIQRDAYFRLKGDEPGLLAYYPFEKYSDVGFGQLGLTETTNDQSDKSAIGLYPFNADLKGGSFTATSAPVKIERPVEAVTFTYVVNNDEIIITPTIAPERIENTILDITVRNMQDLNGNKMSSAVTWTAFVNQNQVVWSESVHNTAIEKGKEYAFSLNIDNLGGKVEDYTILNLPSWLEVNSTTGTINPQSSKTINFTVLEGLNIGQYEENIVLSTRFGDSEVLTLDLNVTGETPNWTIDPSNFEYSMGVVGQLKINEVFSTDQNDMVAAFVGEELRGVANLDYMSGSSTYRVYLNIYSNTAQGEELTFRIWDAGAGVVFEDVTPEMTFVNNSLEGTQANPVVFSGGGIQLSSINLQAGWNWISFNVAPQNTNVDSVLSKYSASNNDLIKGSEHYDQYLNTVGWVGSLSDAGGIDFHESYKIRVEKEGILNVKGAAIDLSSTSVNIQTGWNWLGYLGANILQIDEALSSYEAAKGDVVKGQKSFAVYDPSEGWVGSLSTLEPGKGYMLKASSEGQIIYPERTAFATARVASSFNVLDVELKESNMNVLAELVTTNPELFDDYILIARNTEGKLLGAVEDLNALYYLNVQGDYATGEISFFLKDPATSDEIALEEKAEYRSDALIGYPASFKLHLAEGDIVHAESALLYPNPLGTDENFNIQLISTENSDILIEVYSLHGLRIAEVFNGQVTSGVSNFIWQTSELSSGMYTVVITRNGKKEVLKFTK